jgi:hypothetical protein
MEELINALQEIQLRRIVLVPTARTVQVWAPGVRVPSWICQTVRQYCREILTIITRSETIVCPTVELHRRYWDTIAGRQKCMACARVERGMRRTSRAQHHAPTQVA